MKRFIVAALACAALAGPARAEPETKTQLVAIDGRNVETMRLRDGSTYATCGSSTSRMCSIGMNTAITTS